MVREAWQRDNDMPEKIHPDSLIASLNNLECAWQQSDIGKNNLFGDDPKEVDPVKEKGSKPFEGVRIIHDDDYEEWLRRRCSGGRERSFP